MKPQNYLVAWIYLVSRDASTSSLIVLAVDAVHADDGKDYILEVNDTAIGLSPQHEEEDMELIRNLTLERMRESFSKKSLTQREKIDTTSLYKKLEVELINSRNTKLELERQLADAKKKFEELSSAVQQRAVQAQNYLYQAFGGGFTTGVLVGAVFGILGFKYREQLRNQF